MSIYPVLFYFLILIYNIMGIYRIGFDMSKSNIR